MNVSVSRILEPYDYRPELIEKVSERKVPNCLIISPPDPTWTDTYKDLEAQIQYALGSQCVYIAHIGSTSVPGLSAKNIIDIDLTVRNAAEESTYVPALEAIGFQLLTRERHYYEHRFFISYEPKANLHVYSTDSAEVIRHMIFRDRLRNSIEDRELYGRTKVWASETTIAAGEKMSAYTARKQDVVREILNRAFRDVGFVRAGR